jgi:hypothetical protein
MIERDDEQLERPEVGCSGLVMMKLNITRLGMFANYFIFCDWQYHIIERLFLHFDSVNE